MKGRKNARIIAVVLSAIMAYGSAIPASEIVTEGQLTSETEDQILSHAAEQVLPDNEEFAEAEFEDQTDGSGAEQTAAADETRTAEGEIPDEESESQGQELPKQADQDRSGASEDEYQTEAGVNVMAISETDSPDQTQPEETSGSLEMYYVNPVYEAVYDGAYLRSRLREVSDAGNVPETAAVTYGSEAEAVAVLKGELVNRTQTISVGLSSSAAPTKEQMSAIFNGAIACDANSKSYEGDAVRGDYLSWKCSGSYYTRKGVYYITMKYTVVYCTTYDQEMTLRTAVKNAVSGLNIGNASTYEKIRAIHDYISGTVSYDHSSDNGTLKHSAYAALINKSAVCQGYATCFYRMCREAGVPTRFITGVGINNSGATENHAWNIAAIDGKYYNVDTTWDAGTQVSYKYFLKSNTDFVNHTRDAEFTTSAFNQSYPMAQTSYPVSGSNTGSSFTGIKESGGVQYYYENGVIQSGYTGLYKYNGIWYYIEKGAVNKNYAGLVKYNGVWFYVSGGQINKSYDGLVKFNGVWFYVSGGQINKSYDGLVKFNGVWFYVSGGQINKTYNGLVKFNGVWFYVSGGQINKTYNGLVKFNGVWFYVSGGQINKTYNGLVKFNGVWFYVSGGQINKTYNGLVKFNGVWFYVSGGQINKSFVGLVKFNGAWFYVSGGQINKSFSGVIQQNGVRYRVSGGIGTAI